MASGERQRTIFVLYHFFHPDDVISARLFSELAAHWSGEGHSVTALPSVRSCHSANTRLPTHERWQGVRIRRIWRPALQQSSNIGRLLNTLFMLWGWTWQAVRHCQLFRRREPAPVVVIGTDPIFGILAAIPWRLFLPGCRIVHWCHDVHPEASLADGKLSESSLLVKCLRWVMRRAYRRCDAVIDLGKCMRERLARAGGWSLEQPAARGPQLATITPWSLVEPAGPVPALATVRQELFGDAQLGLLYSGNLGRAHSFSPFLDLARLLQTADRRQAAEIGFCFAGRGLGIDALGQQLSPQDRNIRLAGFAPEGQLEERLAAGDIHMVSLKESWTGTVVPSKFFGALAIGRPVLFVGSESSSIAGWIREHRVGWCLTTSNLQAVADELLGLVESPDKLLALKVQCQNVYRDSFSRQVQFEAFDGMLTFSGVANRRG